MADEEKSPAVASLEQEQARQNAREAKDELDEALKGTFPASDPVSMTTTSIPTRQPDAFGTKPSGAKEDRVASRGASLIDHAVAMVREHPLSAVGIVAALAFAYGASR